MMKNSVPAMIAEYETKLPGKKLPQARLHESYQMLATSIDEEDEA